MRVLAAILALAALPVAGAEYRALGDRPAVLYDAPSTRADRLFVASRLYPFEVLVKLDQWTKVRDSNGEVAWVENSALGSRPTVLVKLDQWTKVRDANGEVAWVENAAFGPRARRRAAR